MENKKSLLSLSFLLHLWKRLIQLGVHQDIHANKIRLIALLNRVSLIFVGASIAYAFINICLGTYEFLLITFCFSIAFAIIPFLNHHRFYVFARYYFWFILASVSALTAILLSKAASVIIYFVAVGIVPLLLFDDKKILNILLIINVLIFVFLNIYQFHFTSILYYGGSVEEIFHYLNFLLVFTVTYLMTYYFKKMGKEYEGKLLEQNQLIEKKNEDITASITYAKRIQAAMLPSIEKFNRAFGEYFIFYKPRDIVSGDFYYLAHPDHNPIIAVADCTGHGVPGAFMSLIGHDALSYLIENQKIESLDLVLSHLNQHLITVLSQGNSQVKDGMDIALCRLDTQAKKLFYAGAMNPLYYVQNGHFQEVKADKQPISGQASAKPYTLHCIDVSQPTMVYLCSDGYQDQFGGKDDRKFMVKKLKELLLKISALPMHEQHQILESTLSDWMGEQRQIDDILIIGLKIS